MAGKELFGAAQVGVQGVRIAVAGGEQDLGRGYEQNLANIYQYTSQRCLREEWAHTWCWTGVHWLGRVLRKKARRKGFRTGGIQSTCARSGDRTDRRGL
jgi:hypothetical protein